MHLLRRVQTEVVLLVLALSPGMGAKCVSGKCRLKVDERVISLSLSSGSAHTCHCYVSELEEWYDPSISSSIDVSLTLYAD